MIRLHIVKLIEVHLSFRLTMNSLQPRKARFSNNPDGAPTFNPSDVFVILDGGRPGLILLKFNCSNFGMI